MIKVNRNNFIVQYFPNKKYLHTSGSCSPELGNNEYRSETTFKLDKSPVEGGEINERALADLAFDCKMKLVHDRGVAATGRNKLQKFQIKPTAEQRKMILTAIKLVENYMRELGCKPVQVSPDQVLILSKKNLDEYLGYSIADGRRDFKTDSILISESGFDMFTLVHELFHAQERKIWGIRNKNTESNEDLLISISEFGFIKKDSAIMARNTFHEGIIELSTVDLMSRFVGAKMDDLFPSSKMSSLLRKVGALPKKLRKKDLFSKFPQYYMKLPITTPKAWRQNNCYGGDIKVLIDLLSNKIAKQTGLNSNQDKEKFNCELKKAFRSLQKAMFDPLIDLDDVLEQELGFSEDEVALINAKDPESYFFHPELYSINFARKFGMIQTIRDIKEARKVDLSFLEAKVA